MKRQELLGHSQYPASRNSNRCPAVDPNALVLALLHQLTAAPDRLAAFLDLTGLRPDRLRADLADGSLRAALFHHVLGHEDLLLEAAAALGCSPEAVANVAGGQPSEGKPGSTEP